MLFRELERLCLAAHEAVRVFLLRARPLYFEHTLIVFMPDSASSRLL